MVKRNKTPPKQTTTPQNTPPVPSDAARRRTRIVRAAWLLSLATGLVAPAVWLWTLPGGFEKHVIAAVITVVAAALPGVLWAWRGKGDLRARTALACVWTVGVAWGAAAVASGLGWLWLELAAGAACLAVGSAVFVVLERRRGHLLPPRPRSLLHVAAGLPIAYLPSLLVWAWLLLG